MVEAGHISDAGDTSARQVRANRCKRLFRGTRSVSPSLESLRAAQKLSPKLDRFVQPMFANQLRTSVGQICFCRPISAVQVLYTDVLDSSWSVFGRLGRSCR